MRNILKTRIVILIFLVFAMLNAVYGILVDFNGETIVLCESKDPTCSCNDVGGANYRCDVRDYLDSGNLESSITIDDCTDGAYNNPTDPWFDGDWIFEDVVDISREDLNGSISNPYDGGLIDNFLRIGDDIEISVTFLCSVDIDSYNILYKNNTDIATPWELLATGFCQSYDFANWDSQEQIITVTKKLDEAVGNHTIRAMVSYSGAGYMNNPNAECGQDMPEPDTSDTDDLVLQVLDSLDLDPPEITLISPGDGEAIELVEGQTINIIADITDKTGIDFVNISMEYDSTITKLNYSKIGNRYYANLTNITKLGQYTLIFYTNDTIETNSTTKTRNHVNNYTTSTFILKDEVGFTLFSPIFNKAYSAIATLLDFLISDVNTPYNEVYYLFNSTKITLNDSENIIISNGSLGMVNNSISNISQSINLTKDMTVQRIDLHIRSIGNDKNRTIYLRNDSSGPGTILRTGKRSNISGTSSWHTIWLNDSINLTLGEKYWITLQNDNATDYVEWSYGNEYSRGESYHNSSVDMAIKMFDLYNYNTTLNSNQGFNSIHLCENNSLGNEECSYTQYYIDLYGPTFSLLTYSSVVEYGSNQQISVKISDAYAGVNSSTIKIEYNNSNRSMTYNSGTKKYEYSISNLTPGNYNFTIYAKDNLGWSSSIGPYTFSYGDNQAPTLSSITYSPTASSDLDPNKMITFNFTLSDLGGLSSNIYLQYRPNTTSIWTNVLATSLGSGKYIANFTPTLETKYYYRVNAKDNFGNELNSTQQSITVGYERTWSVYPLTYSLTTVDLGETINLYNVTVTNLGDVNSTFSIAKDPTVTYSMTFSSSSFTVAPNNNITIQVNITAPGISNQYYPSTAIITCLTGETAIKTVGDTIYVGGEGPFLDLKIYKKIDEGMILSDIYKMRFNDNTYTTPHELVAEIKNIAEFYAADNITFWYEFPNSSTGWFYNLDANSSNMTANFSLEKKNFDDTAQFSAVFTIDRKTSRAILHNVTIHANLLYNGTWRNFTKKVQINVTNVEEVVDETVIIPPSTPPSGDTSPPPETPPTIDNAPGGSTNTGAGLGGGTLIKYNLLVFNPKIADLLRGSNRTVQINITNPYKNKYFADITFILEGYYSNQISFSPKKIDTLAFNETITINLTINAPSYFGYSVNNAFLTFDYLVVNTGLNKSTGENMSAKSNMTIIVNEIDRSDSLKCLEKSMLLIRNITDSTDFNIDLLNDLLDRQKKAISGLDFTLAEKLCKDIDSTYHNIFMLYDKLVDINNSIYLSENEGYDMDNIHKLFNMSNNLFKQGKYEELKTTLSELEETYLIQIKLEDAQLFNRFKRFVKNSLKEIIAFIIISTMLSAYITSQVKKSMLKHKISDLKNEKDEIQKKLKELQNQYFNDKLIGKNFYDLHTNKYKDRVGKINDLLVYYETKQMSNMKFDDSGSLDEREKKITDMIKELQKNYYIDKSLDKRSYDKSLEIYKKSLAKIKKERIILENKKPNRMIDRIRRPFIVLNEKMHGIHKKSSHQDNLIKEKHI